MAAATARRRKEEEDTDHSDDDDELKDRVVHIHAALQQLIDERRRKGKKKKGEDETLGEEEVPAPAEEEDRLRLISRLLSQAKECENEGEAREMGMDEVVKELRRVRRQNTITHCLLSVMIVVIAVWQLSEVSLLLTVKNKFSNPFRAVGNMIKGALKDGGNLLGGGNLQDSEKLSSSLNNRLLEAAPLPQISVPELPLVDLPSLPFNGGGD